MVKNSEVIVQIVPGVPGTQDGVGDYALTIARKLRDMYGCDTLFAAAKTVGEADRFPDKSAEFDVVPLIDILSPAAPFHHVILHYVNYGYHKRGIPFWLLSVLEKLRQRPLFLLTIFHELYASGPPWKSEFWLRPFQIRIAKSISRASDACLVSSDTMRRQLNNLTPDARIRVHPVFSNFGEPSISSDQLSNRSSNRWVICGGTALVERSMRSLQTIINRIPKEISPRELFVIGGNENPVTRCLLAGLPNIRIEYHPQISAAEASQILSSCSFAWLDYFHRTDVPTDIILKSSVFAAACAHGVIPVFPHQGSAIFVDTDRLSGPFFVSQTDSEVPGIDDRPKVSAEIYNWYQRNAASDHLVREIADTLELNTTFAGQ